MYQEISTPFVNVLELHAEQFERRHPWIASAPVGTELMLFFALITGLMHSENINADDIKYAFPDRLADLPWLGCEHLIAEVLVRGLRGRGPNGDDIKDLAHTIAQTVIDIEKQAMRLAPANPAMIIAGLQQSRQRTSFLTGQHDV